LAQLGSLTVVPPDAHFVFAGLPEGVSAAAVADEMFSANRYLIKDCGGKAAADGQQWLRVTSRGRAPDGQLAKALALALRRFEG
jgi:histidinol-phosphate/aromatic aminotransferase/cobyric acid decarboxylase-like protein